MSGYHLSIVRTKSEGEEIPIERDEVLDLVKKLDALEVYKSSDDDLDLIYKLPGDRVIYLFWAPGDLWIEDTEEDEQVTRETVEKLVQLARHFNARVRGEELETYRSFDDTYVHPHDAKLIEFYKNAYPRWKNWLWQAAPFLFFVMVGLIFHFVTRGM